MKLIKEEELKVAAIESRPKKFIGIEHYDSFKNGVELAEAVFEKKLHLIVKYVLSERNSDKSIEEIAKDILENDVLQG